MKELGMHSKQKLLIKPVRSEERAILLALAVETGLFLSEEAEGLLGTVLDELHAQSLPAGHAAVTCRRSSEEAAVGWAYFAPDPYAEQVWNLWWIGVLPGHHGSGAASALLAHVEHAASQAGARVVVIETSDLDSTGRARNFYVKSGYRERGRIPDYYGQDESKVIFSRSL